MVMTDPIADYLTRIRNANMAKHDSVEIPASNIKKSISEILKREGFIRDYEVADDNKQGVIKVFLKYGPNRERVISGLKRISKPGLRNYVSAEDLPKVLNGLGIAIVSTSSGVITDKEARQKNVGGEVIATFGNTDRKENNQ
ncbi:30S ribosomal protein S8 [Lactobacillus kefiranofaciens]|uniref:30S ribosomal protein S8 n=1 Tax=Lactobacillus kefiranofaciens TaxID=267818 RepID=UPI0004687C2C|nr:30S ribosomal protein S8 [Lactobacillus kefiranofaciens]